MSFRRWIQSTVIRTTLVVGGIEYTTHIFSEGRSSHIYHYTSDQWVIPLLRTFLPAEMAHNVAVWAASKGLTPTHRPSAAEQRVQLSQTLFDGQLTVEHPIGLAAGFDKHGEVIGPMLRLGLAAVEIGTVTPLAQAGNPAPRMFRLTQDRGIINRYGFNSVGSNKVEENLRAYRESLIEKKDTADRPWYMRLFQLIYHPSPPKGVVGVNIGKNKVTSKEQAVHDYTQLIRQLGPYADYLVINISSPNTPGLRDLQHDEQLLHLLQLCLATRNTLARRVPLLVKIAPDLTDEQLQSIGTTCLQVGLDGVVVTNTTNARPSDLVSKHKQELGGLSGAPIKDRSTETIRKLYGMTNGNLLIIGVGGIANGQDAYDKLCAGASLVQVYSMLVYEGPGAVSRIREQLANIMLQHGQRSLEDVIGNDHELLSWQRRERRQLEERRKYSKVALNKMSQ